MPAVHTADLNLTPKDISHLALTDAVARWPTMLGYDTSRPKPLTPESIGLAAAIKQRELLTEDSEGFLRVVLVQFRGAHGQKPLRPGPRAGADERRSLLILTRDFSTLVFVLLDKRRRESRGPVGRAADSGGAAGGRHRSQGAPSGGSPGPCPFAGDELL